MSRPYLDLPVDTRMDPEALRVLNERLRRIASLVGGTGSGSAAAAAGGSTLILSVPGTLSIRSNAAPLVKLASPRTLTKLTALLKQPPAGGDLIMRLLVDGAAVASITVPAGQVQAVSVVSVAIAAESLITVDITSVGYTFGGSDLSLILVLA